MPAASSAAMSSDGMPRTRSSVSTRSAVCDQITSGTYRSSSRAKCAQHAGVGAFALQVEFGVSVFSISRTISRGGSCRRRDGAVDHAGDRCSRAMSAAICFSMSGAAP
jgi:hypothetical protein